MAWEALYAQSWQPAGDRLRAAHAILSVLRLDANAVMESPLEMAHQKRPFHPVHVMLKHLREYAFHRAPLCLDAVVVGCKHMILDVPDLQEEYRAEAVRSQQRYPDAP